MMGSMVNRLDGAILRGRGVFVTDRQTDRRTFAILELLSQLKMMLLVKAQAFKVSTLPLLSTIYVILNRKCGESKCPKVFHLTSLTNMVHNFVHTDYRLKIPQKIGVLTMNSGILHTQTHMSSLSVMTE